MEIIQRRNKRKYQTQKIAKCTVTSSSYFIMPLLLLVFCTVTSCYTFRYTVIYLCLIPLNQLNIIIKACGSWSPYIGREVSSYFRPQTSKFRLYSSHFRHRNLDFRLTIFTINFCAHRAGPNHLFQNYFNREDCTGGHV